MESINNILNFEAISNASLFEDPFRWALLENSFTSEVIADALSQSFPSDFYGQKRRRLGESSSYGGHLLVGRGLVARQTGDVFQPASLDPRWLQLVDELMSDRYRKAMETLTGIDLADTQRELICFRQPVGAYLDPHPDNRHKPVSQVFYFSQSDWDKDDGGCLRILRSRDQNDIFAEIEPRINRSVILVRSDHSWHGYPPVKTSSKGPRLCLQLFFCRPEMKFATEYGPDWTKAPVLTRNLWANAEED